MAEAAAARYAPRMAERRADQVNGSKNGALISRARYSLRGIAEGWRRERSIRDYLLVSIVGVAALAWAAPPAGWWAACLLAGSVGLAVEYLNAAIEALLDKLHPEHHPAIGAAKDMASAAVLVLDIAALLILGLALGHG